MAFVYWIHLKEHDDITTQGYVGITTMSDPYKRFSKHLSDSKDDRKSFVVHKAIRKYGDRIIFEVIKECSKEEACSEELRLRPEENIGWNILKGGVSPRVGWKPPPDFVEKIKASRKRNGKTQRRPKEATFRQKETLLSKHPLDLHGINLDVWRWCLVLYELFLEGNSMYVASKKVGVSKGSCLSMWKRFQSGWNPQCDERLLSYVADNPPKEMPPHTKLESNTKILGVSYRKGRYVAYIGLDGNTISKSFSTLKYGEEGALSLAVSYRKQLESQYLDNVS